jgi:nucleotide-binding universal stress UspA family protein
MLRFQSILVPVDISEPKIATPALEHAVDLAHAANSNIRLIYVRSGVPAPSIAVLPPNFDADQQRASEERLATVADGIPLPKGRVSTAVHTGSVYDEVLKEAEEMGADLIIVGSHRPSTATYLLGSNAATIVRHAKCSVLVVR